MIEQEIIYTAGLFDGEGSVCLVCKNRKKNKNITRHPQAQITNTSKEIIDFLYSVFGGYIKHQKGRKENHKQSWVWSIECQKGLNFLKLIRPYLKDKEKIRRIDLIFEFYHKVTPRNGFYTEELLENKRLFEVEFFKNSRSSTLRLK